MRTRPAHVDQWNGHPGRRRWDPQRRAHAADERGWVALAVCGETVIEIAVPREFGLAWLEPACVVVRTRHHEVAVGRHEVAVGRHDVDEVEARSRHAGMVVVRRPEARVTLR